MDFSTKVGKKKVKAKFTVLQFIVSKCAELSNQSELVYTIMENEVSVILSEARRA